MPKFVRSAAWVRWGIAVVALFATPRLAGAARDAGIEASGHACP